MYLICLSIVCVCIVQHVSNMSQYLYVVCIVQHVLICTVLYVCPYCTACINMFSIVCVCIVQHVLICSVLYVCVLYSMY